MSDSKPYMGRPKPTGRGDSTAKVTYVLAFVNKTFYNLTSDDMMLLGGHKHYMVSRILRYAKENNRATVIEPRLSNRPIYRIYKYWENDLHGSRDYIDLLYPFPANYGVVNFSGLDVKRWQGGS